MPVRWLWGGKFYYDCNWNYMCELASYSAFGYPDRVEHIHTIKIVNSNFMGDGELKILLSHTKNSPTESALDPSYGEIQESYLF